MLVFEPEPLVGALVLVPEPSPGLPPPPPESDESQPVAATASNAPAVRPRMLRNFFMCLFGVVLNRRRTPSSAAGAVVSLIKKVGEAKVFQEIVCRALFAGSGIHPPRRVSYLQANTDAHRLGLNVSAAKLCQSSFLSNSKPLCVGA